MKPYYSEDGIAIYHADCRAVLPSVACDLLLTDPPYGIGADVRQAARAGKQPGNAAAPSRDYGPVTHWDASPVDGALLADLIAQAKASIVWGGNYFGLPPQSGWLVWDKRHGVRSNGYADAELAWTNLGGAVRIFRHLWMGMYRGASDDGRAREHPTQKPVPLMRWCLSRWGEQGTVLDPFMGSGSTLVAAKAMHLSAIGIEIEERYCEIAAQRLSQGVLAL